MAKACLQVSDISIYKELIEFLFIYMDKKQNEISSQILTEIEFYKGTSVLTICSQTHMDRYKNVQ